MDVVAGDTGYVEQPALNHVPHIGEDMRVSGVHRRYRLIRKVHSIVPKKIVPGNKLIRVRHP